MIRKVAIFALLIILATPVLAQQLTIYSGRNPKFLDPLLQSFAHQTGITINLISGNSSILLSRLSLEDRTTAADIYIGNDVGNLYRGSSYGLFNKISKSLLSLVPAKHRSPDDDWIGLSGRLRVLVVNTESRMSDNLDSIYDLSKPDLKGKIGITYASNESFIGGATSYFHIVGKEKNRQWLQGLKENAGHNLYKKHSKIVQAVAYGNKVVGLVNHYYALQFMQKFPEAPIKLVIPDQGKDQIGVAWNMTGIAVSRFSKQPEVAEKLLAYLLSKEQQKIFAEVNQEYPVLSGVTLAKGVPAMESFRNIQTPIAEIGRQRDDTITEFHRLRLRY